jgi:hypothetical protein
MGAQGQEVPMIRNPPCAWFLEDLASVSMARALYYRAWSSRDPFLRPKELQEFLASANLELFVADDKAATSHLAGIARVTGPAPDGITMQNGDVLIIGDHNSQHGPIFYVHCIT